MNRDAKDQKQIFFLKDQKQTLKKDLEMPVIAPLRRLSARLFIEAELSTHTISFKELPQHDCEALQKSRTMSSSTWNFTHQPDVWHDWLTRQLFPDQNQNLAASLGQMWGPFSLSVKTQENVYFREYSNLNVRKLAICTLQKSSSFTRAVAWRERWGFFCFIRGPHSQLS